MSNLTWAFIDLELYFVESKFVSGRSVIVLDVIKFHLKYCFVSFIHV